MMIIRKIFFCIWLCFVAFQAFPQYSTMGGKIGVNFSNFNGDIKDNRVKIGPSLGAFYTYVHTKEWGVTVEAFYSMQGAKMDSSSFNDATFELKYATNYFQVPVLITYFNGVFSRRNKTVVKAFAGPQFGYRISAKESIVAENGTQINKINSRISPLNLDVVFGLGAHFKVKKNQWASIDCRYNIGVSNLRKGDLVKWRHSVASINLGISLPSTRVYKKHR